MLRDLDRQILLLTAKRDRLATTIAGLYHELGITPRLVLR